jgi:exopolysaccharide production protein ExoQ
MTIGRRNAVYRGTVTSEVAGCGRTVVNDDTAKVVRDRRSSYAVIFVAFYCAIFNIAAFAGIVTLGSITFLFLIYVYLYHWEFYHFCAKNIFVLFYPLVVMLSASWSIVPGTSLYYGIQLSMTIIIGILMGVSATQRQLIRGVFVGNGIVCVASILYGAQGPSAVGPVLIGLTGSKDAMGFVGMTLAASAMGVLFDRGQPIVYRCAALFLMPLGAYIATHVEAASTMVATVAFAIAFLGCLCIRRVYGTLLIILALVWALAGLGIAINEGVFNNGGEIVLRALNKDPTLTGRTVLWDEAGRWIAREPELGSGFRSFWLGPTLDSLYLLQRFGQSDGRGFQFHQTFIEIIVDTGWFGLFAFSIVIVLFLTYVLANLFVYPNAPSAFIASMFLLLLSRISIETIVLVFSPYTVLFYACGTAAIVFFMNRGTAPRNRATTTGMRPRRRLGFASTAEKDL